MPSTAELVKRNQTLTRSLSGSTELIFSVCLIFVRCSPLLNRQLMQIDVDDSNAENTITKCLNVSGLTQRWKSWEGKFIWICSSKIHIALVVRLDANSLFKVSLLWMKMMRTESGVRRVHLNLSKSFRCTMARKFEIDVFPVTLMALH